MTQDDYDNQMIIQGLEPYQEKEDKEPKKEVKKDDPKLKLLLSQILLCALGLLAVFTIKFLDNDISTAIKQKYSNMIYSTSTLSEVKATLKSILKDSSQNDNASKTADATGDAASSTDVPSKIETTPISSTKTIFSPIAISQKKGLTASVINSMVLPVKGEITSDYGYRTHPIYNTDLFHRGIDIADDLGNEIKSVLDGIVITSEYDSSYGNFIVIRHSDHLKTLYAHCSELFAKSGQQVQRGEVIALVGNTGVSTGPHLHFEVHYNDVLINPRWLLKI